jgi:DegT/DnrJ/EryC1/StrS aminotransferase family
LNRLYAVTTNSCTMALLLAVKWNLRNEHTFQDAVMYGGPGVKEIKVPMIEIPKRTYVGVPMSIIHAGGLPVFRGDKWVGAYRLDPLPVWDSARWFTSGMYYQDGAMMCVSFHASKTLGDSQGGAILHDNPEADAWLRRMRFDGRTEGVAPKDDKITEVGFHCYLSPDVAARLLHKLTSLPKHNDPLPWGPGTNSDYPDLSQMECFK